MKLLHMRLNEHCEIHDRFDLIAIGVFWAGLDLSAQSSESIEEIEVRTTYQLYTDNAMNYAMRPFMAHIDPDKSLLCVYARLSYVPTRTDFDQLLNSGWRYGDPLPDTNYFSPLHKLGLTTKVVLRTKQGREWKAILRCDQLTTHMRHK